MIEIPRSYSVNFVVDFIVLVMRDMLKDYKNSTALKNISMAFGFNAYDALEYMFNNLYIDFKNNNIQISINKNLHYKGHPVEVLLNAITFGNRTTRGCDVFVKICDYIENNLDGLYLLYASGGR